MKKELFIKSLPLGSRLYGNVLIVTDDRTSSDILEILLHRYGLQTITTYSQSEAIKGVQVAQPELVIIDRVKFKDDSYEVLKALRQATSVPILFLSEGAPNGQAAHAFELGANAFMQQPFSPLDLLQQVDCLLTGKRTVAKGFLIPKTGNPKIATIVPAYNEERFIGSVILKARQYSETVVVIDDGSSDCTAQVARDAGALVISHARNQGKGAALNTAFNTVRKLRLDVVVMLDADGQHNPEEIYRVIDPVILGKADIVIGSRYIESTSQVPRVRVIGHWAFNLVTRLASGEKASDSQSGFRAFSPKAVEAISFHSNGFSVESEMQFIAHENHLILMEVPITIRYSDPPKRSVISQGLQVLNGILHLAGQYRPLLFIGLPGLLLLLAGLGTGMWTIDRYTKVREVAIGHLTMTILLINFGLVLFTTGFILHSIRALLNSKLSQHR